MVKWKNKGCQIFTWIFFCTYLLVFGKVLLGDEVHQNDTIVLLPYLVLGVGIVFLSNYVFHRSRAFIEKHYYIILINFLAIYGFVVLVNGFQLQFTPVFDMDAIYSGAVQWLREGSFPTYYQYYGYFSNNLGAMTVLHFVFRLASVFGIGNFFAVGILFNSFLITATAAIVSLTCKKLRDEIAGVTALVFFVLCVPFSLMGTVFYTDSLSLLYPVLFYYLYLHFKEQKTWKRRILFAIAMALALALGMLIKFTVLIVLIAVAMDTFLHLNWREAGLIVVCSGLIAYGAFGLMNGYMYRYHLDEETCKQLKTPYLHWVMMGLKDNGSYNPDDYDFTRSKAPEKRSEACFQEIMERIDEMKLSGLISLWMRKVAVCFGDGTYALSEFLGSMPIRKHWLHKYILYDGENYYTYRHFTTGMLLSVYFFMLAGAWQCLRGKEREQGGILAPRLACIGILVFLLLWETNGRYFTNYIPLMLVCAVLSLDRQYKK